MISIETMKGEEGTLKFMKWFEPKLIKYLRIFVIAIKIKQSYLKIYIEEWQRNMTLFFIYFMSIIFSRITSKSYNQSPELSLTTIFSK